MIVNVSLYSVSALEEKADGSVGGFWLSIINKHLQTLQHYYKDFREAENIPVLQTVIRFHS